MLLRPTSVQIGKSSRGSNRRRYVGGAQVQRREVEIVNKQGLDASASSKLAQVAAKYLCDVSLARAGRKVNAKSLMGVMMLAARQGSRVVVETEGPDETEALDALVALIGDTFG
jgi:phosphocarrier protein